MYKKIHDDFYFEEGHWFKKVWQSLIAILFWFLMAIPCIVTIGSYLAYLTNGKFGYYFWRYTEGFRELNFLVIFFIFLIGMMAVFCLTVAFIQNQRRHQLTEKWPMYDMQKSNHNQIRTNAIATIKFGPQQYRHQVTSYVVDSEQNFKKNELKDYVD